MTKTAFINGNVINCNENSKELLNILISNHKILGLGYLPDEDQDTSQIMDVAKMVIVPEIIDFYAQIGNGYQDNAESIASVSQAALNGGITSVICAPSLGSDQDTPEAIVDLQQKIKKDGKVGLLPIGAITKKREGLSLAEIGLMKEKGVLALSDGKPIADISIMKQALRYSAMFDLPLLITPDQGDLKIGDMNEGYFATILGLRGISPLNEELMIQRDLNLLSSYGGKIHFSPISTQKSVNLIRDAKKRGLNVTCGTAPHYLYLSEENIDGYDTNTKVNPPFRDNKDIKALIEGLRDGTIDVLASHHQPKAVESKRTDFSSADFGISGLDLFLSLIFTKLLYEEKFDLIDLVKKFTLNPLEILGLKANAISLNQTPNFTVIDLNEEKTIKLTDLRSKGKNTPFIGKKLKGFAKYTVVEGRINKND